MEVLITAERLRELVSYSPDTGVMTAITRRAQRCPIGSVIGNPSTDGHLKAMLDRRMYLIHRLAWLYVHGEWPHHQIDHINGDPTDNRLCNLRDVSQLLNNQNQRDAQKANKTGYLGVHKKRGRFIAALNRGKGGSRHIGCFATAEEAHAAYLEEKRRLHPGCTI
jgi:hypothetical protein